MIVGELVVKITTDTGGLTRGLVEASAEVRMFSDAVDNSNSKTKEAEKSTSAFGRAIGFLSSNWKIAAPLGVAVAGAVLQMTAGFGALLPIIPILTTMIGLLLTPLTSLAAILAASTGPLLLLTALMGGLGAAFFLGGQRALTAHHHFAQFQDTVDQVKNAFKGLTTELASVFLPYFDRLAHAALIAINYFKQLAHMPLAEAMHSVATRGIAMLTRFVYDVAQVLAKPFRLAVQVAFGSNGADGALAKYVNSLQGYLFGHQQTHQIVAPSGKVIGTATQNIPGALQPIVRWFDRQDFTATGRRWGNEIASGMVTAIGAGIKKLLSSRGGMVIGAGAGAGGLLGGILGTMINPGAGTVIGAGLGAGIGAGLGVALNHYWPRIKSAAIGAFHSVGAAAKKAIGPMLWNELAKDAKSFVQWVKMIANFLTGAVYPVVKHIWDALGGWHTVGVIIAIVLRGIVGVVIAVAAAVRVVWNVLTIIWNVISTIYDVARRIAELIGGALVAAVNGLKSAWSAVSSAFSTVAGYVGTIVGGIRSAVGLATSLAHAASSIHFPSIPGSGVVSGIMSHLASGGIATRPTTRLIGESGPEAVIPLTGPNGRAAMNSLGGGGGSSVVINMNFNGFADRASVRAAARALKPELERIVNAR